MVSPDRAFARLVLVSLAAGGFLGTVALLLVALGTAGTAPSPAGAASFWCLVSPVSSLDVAVHTSAVGVALLAGLALLFGWGVVSRERARVAELRWATHAARLGAVPARVAAVAQAVGVVGDLDVVDGVRPYAFVYGWWRPRICLSMAMVDRLTDRELEAVLHHERWHLVRRDPTRVLVVRAIAAAFPCLPPIRCLVEQYLLATEIAADRHAVVAMGRRHWLASALAKTLDGTPVLPAFAGHAEARIATLAGEPLPARGGRGRTAAVILAGEAVVLAATLTGGGLPLAGALGLHPVC